LYYLYHYFEGLKKAKNMKRFLVTFDEQTSPIEPQAALSALQGVVEISSVSDEQMDSMELSLPGPALTPQAIEELAASMEADQDFLSEQESEKYLLQLKSAWRKQL
jgi:hypothetical protein